jgi:HEAT repeat protein
VTAAMALAASSDGADVAAADAALRRLADDSRQTAVPARREVAQALGHIRNPQFRYLLVPLMYDPSHEVAEEAIRSAGKLGAGDYLFVPPLLSLMRNRLLKGAARAVLVGYGEEILDTLAYIMRDQDEDIWIRRHVPSTLAFIPTQKTVDILFSALDDPDGFLRYKAVGALGRLRRERPELHIPAAPVEQLVVKETNRYFSYLGLHYNLVVNDPVAKDTLLARALSEKLARTVDRIYRLLALIYPWKDVAAARWALEHGDARQRSSSLEYLDNLLTGTVRKRVMPVLEEMPLAEKVRRGNVIVRSRVRDAEDSLAQLVHDDDQVVAATAIYFVESRGLWNLADDLEYALEHRDARHWHVFEAASWALAAHRLKPEERRNRWMEPLPAVELADRLRRIPLFDFVSVDELFRVADTGRQVRHEHGRVLLQQGGTATDLEEPRHRCARAARLRRGRGGLAGARDGHGRRSRHLPGAPERAGARVAVGEHGSRPGALPDGHGARDRPGLARRRARRRRGSGGRPPRRRAAADREDSRARAAADLFAGLGRRPRRARAHRA